MIEKIEHPDANNDMKLKSEFLKQFSGFHPFDEFRSYTELMLR